MKNVTFVSALFDIDRVDGRKWDQYLKWFDMTLKLRVPMLLFITEDLQEFVDERRGDLPTKTVHITADEIPYYHLKEPIQEILDSDVYFWLDAGGSRFFNNFDLSEEYPGVAAMESIEGMGESFLVQMNCEYYEDLYSAKTLDENYLYDNRSYVLGSMFGGHKNTIPKIVKMVDSVLMDDMIAENNMNNEQIALGYLVKKYPDDFAIYSRTNGQHMDIFTELST